MPSHGKIRRPTIFNDQWKEAQRRTRSLKQSKRAKLYAQVLDHLEEGWSHVQQLGEVRGAAGNPIPHTPEAAVLYLLDTGIWECFRTVANECVEVICTKTHEGAPLDDLHADVDELHANLHLARLLRPEELEPELRQLLQQASEKLLPWVEAFHPIWTAMAEMVEPRKPR